MKISSNEPDAFQAVYESTFPVIVRVAYHITLDVEVAEDICQEAFIRFLERVDTFPDDKQATYWLIRVVKNLTLNFKKRKQREQKAYKKFMMEPVKTSETGETEYLRSETQQKVQELLEKLSEKLKTPLVMREYTGLSYKEIGKILRLSEANVKVRVFRARGAIHSMIKEGEVYVP